MERVSSSCLQGAPPGPPLKRSSTNTRLKLEVRDMCSCLEQSQTTSVPKLMFQDYFLCWSDSRPLLTQPHPAPNRPVLLSVLGLRVSGRCSTANGLNGHPLPVPASELACRRGNQLEKWRRDFQEASNSKAGVQLGGSQLGQTRERGRSL